RIQVGQRSLVSVCDPANGTSLALRVGACFRVRNHLRPDDYRASASRADRAVCATASEPHSRLTGLPARSAAHCFQRGLFPEPRCRSVGHGLQDIPATRARADGRLHEASGLLARRQHSRDRPFSAAVSRVNRDAAVRRPGEEAVASLASGQGYKDTRAGREAGKVSPLVRPDRQGRPQRSAVRGAGMVRCFVAPPRRYV
ncbi:hypothetical protein GE09DRAFT_1159974, partial [Coniochaeta sp. 2T2.1]